jgi:cell division protein FtsN
MKISLTFIFLFLLFSFSCRKKIAEDYQYYQPYKRDTVSVKDSISVAVAKDTIQSKKTDDFEIRPVDLNNKYFVVIASFSVEEYALTMKADLIKKGFKPEIFMLNNDGWHKLAIGSYNDFEEASEAMNQIKLKEGLFSNARIVIK